MDPEENNPFGPLLGDLMKALGGAQGSGSPWWDAARTLAQSVATDGQTEANVDPLERMEYEKLARVAEMHVADATGFAASGLGAFEPVSRSTWALRFLEDKRPLLELLVNASDSSLDFTDSDELSGGIGDLLGRFAAGMRPMLLGLQFGSTAGHLARRAVGDYALPLPGADAATFGVLPANVNEFATDWSLPVDEVRLWVCLHELTMHTVLTRPWVRDRFNELTAATVAEVANLQEGFLERLTAEHEGDPDLTELMADPEQLMADLLTPSHQHTSAQLTALTSALTGYVDHITAKVGAALITSTPALAEAWYRRRVDESRGLQGAAALFGIDLSRSQIDRGRAFVRGVVERAGEEGLTRLWARDRDLPTPAEVDAPGLWLERIDLPDPELGA